MVHISECFFYAYDIDNHIISLSIILKPFTIFDQFRSDKPLVHKITNKSKKELYCIDAEVLKSPPVTSPLPLIAEHHTMIKERDRCRVYKLSLEPGQTVTVSYPFFYLSIVLKCSKIKTTIGGTSPHSITYERSTVLGNEAWCTPTLDITITNVGSNTFEQFISEWR